jgi:hypothetical protein
MYNSENKLSKLLIDAGKLSRVLSAGSVEEQMLPSRGILQTLVSNTIDLQTIDPMQRAKGS